MSDIETKVERKPLSKPAKIALRMLNKEFSERMGEILEGEAVERELTPDNGWQFDMKAQEWVRELK